jgi:hypothetical protein
MGMAIVICSVGALLGLLFALFANLVVLPSVLASLETCVGGRYRDLRELVRVVYRYVMPIVFASTERPLRITRFSHKEQLFLLGFNCRCPCSFYRRHIASEPEWGTSFLRSRRDC